MREKGCKGKSSVVLSYLNAFLKEFLHIQKKVPEC